MMSLYMKMKKKIYIIIPILLLSLIAVKVANAKKLKTEQVANTIEYFIVDRKGGGDKLFTLSGGEDESYFVTFGRLNFRDSSFTLSIDSSLFGDTLKGQLEQLFADKVSFAEADTMGGQAHTFFTGTWLKCYVARSGEEPEEITSRNVISIFKEVERLVMDKVNENSNEEPNEKADDEPIEVKF